MASFTSVQTGNWNDGGTWGNTSPGVAGTDYPGVAADTATIAASHVVTYDAGASTVAYGDIVISGTLTFTVGADSTLVMGTTNDITVNASGSFIAGTSTTSIGAAYKCKIIFTQTTTDRTCFKVYDGATVSIYGALSYFNSSVYGELDSDWTSGQTLYLQGDMTGWPVGGYFCINKNTTYSSFSTDTQHYTIASLTYDSGNDRTALVINEAAPGLTFNKNNWGFTGRIYLLDRNVFFGVETFTTTQELTLDFDQTVSNDTVHFEGVEFRGLEDFASGGYNLSFNYCTFAHMDSILSGSYYATLTNCVLYQMYQALYSVLQGIIENTAFLGCDSSLYTTNSDVIDCAVVGANTALYGGTNRQGALIENFLIVSSDDGLRSAYNITAILTCYSVKYPINIVLDSRISITAYNTIEVATGTTRTYITGLYDNAGGSISVSAYGSFTIFEGVITGAVAQSGFSLDGGAIFQNSTIDSKSVPYMFLSRQYEIRSLFSGDTNFQTPPSSNDWVLELKPDTDQNGYSFAHNTGDSLNKTAITSSATKATIKVYVITWADPRINAKGGILLFGMYSSAATSGTTAFNAAEASSIASGSWVSIEIPLTDAADGFFEWTLSVRDDENIILLLDPVVVIS